MSNFDEVKFPPAQIASTHYASIDTYLLDKTLNDLILSSSISTAGSKKIVKDSKVVVLEEGLGRDAAWNYVKFEEEKGFILRAHLTPETYTKPSFPINPAIEKQSNLTAIEIDWREQKPNMVYLDEQKAKFCVHLELPYEKVNGKEDLKEKIKEGYYTGVSLILKEIGRKYDSEYVNNLTNNYFKFAQAEEYYFPLRECSTLRVFVTIPLRYTDSGALAESLDVKKGTYEKEDLQELFSTSVLDSEFSAESDSESDTDGSESADDRYTILKYNNYGEFANHINRISFLLGQQQLIVASGLWEITPSGIFLEFVSETANVNYFFQKINKFINDNTNKPTATNLADAWTKTLVNSLSANEWNGKLEFVIDKEERLILDIRFYNENDESVPLSIAYYSTLKDEIIKNKTTINYLVKINKPVISGVVQQIGTDIAQTAQGLSEGNITALNPDEGFKKFVLENHYPVITDIRRLPLDISDCVQDTARLIQDIDNNRRPAVLRQYDELRQRYVAESAKLEGDWFIKALNNDRNRITDRRLRLIYGLDPIDYKNPITAMNQWLYILNGLDIQRWLLEALKCKVLDFDPQKLAELLEKYKNVKEALDGIAISTVCNPYLQGALKLYTTFRLPILPTTNPYNSLIEELTKLVIKIFNDVVVLAIREILTKSFKDCLDDKRRNSLPNNLSDSFDPNSGELDPAINDLLDDLYGGIYDENGNIDPDALAAAKEKMKGLLNDLSNCLSTSELCALLTGKSVNDSVIEAIISFIKRKYNTPNSNPNLANKFNNKQSVVEFFILLGSNLGAELTVCDDILNQPQGEILFPCPDDEILKLREALLSDKGLTPDLLEDLLKDINDKKAKEVEDLMKFLDSDDPFNYDNIPSVLCKNGVPPAVKVSPSIQTFKKLLDTLFRDVYETFDAEAKNWHKITYSNAGATKTIKFDENGNIVANTEGESTSGVEKIIPFYLFNESINNTNISYQNNISYNLNIDSKKQQDLDIKILEEGIRESLDLSEKQLRDFLGDFNIVYNSYVTFIGLQIGVETTVNLINNIQRANSSASVVQRVLNTFTNLSPTFRTELIKFFKLQDLFIVHDISDIEELKLAYPDKSLLANSVLMAESGVPIYIQICEFLKKYKNEFINMFDQIAAKLAPSSQQTFIDDGRVNNYSDLLIQLDNALKSYDNINKKYELILNTKIKYPSYNINYESGLRNYFSFRAYENENLYDISKIFIKKNNKQYINFGARNKIEDGTKNYILNTLKIDKERFNKKDVLDAYLNLKNQNYNSASIEIQSNLTIDNNIYKSIDALMLSHMANKISSAENLFNTYNINTINTPSGSYDANVPYTQFLGNALTSQQTQQQKSCGVRNSYLDIDLIKKDIVENKEKSLCSVEELKNSNVTNNIAVNTSNLEELETSETQNIILNGTFRLAIRAYLHDIVLRSANLFSYYDPQSLRKDEAFITFIAYLTESEMRGADNTFFSLMIRHFNKMSGIANSNTTSQEFISRDMFRDTVKLELQEFVLPKLAKRIWEDTNKNISSQTGLNGINNLYYPYEQALTTYLDKILFVKEDGIYLLVSNTKANKIFDGSLEQFRNSVEYDLLFGYIFPQNQYLSFLFMSSVLCTGTRRTILDAFSDTKAAIRRLAILTQTNGGDVTPDLNNMQDVINSDNDDLIKKFIFEALFKTPFLIFKGYAEMSEPNLLISSSIYKVLNILIPETPSFIIPPTSGLLFLAGIPPINPIVYGLYLAGLFWYEDKSNSKEANTKAMLLEMIQNTSEQINCEAITQDTSEIIPLTDGVYKTS